MAKAVPMILGLLALTAIVFFTILPFADGIAMQLHAAVK